MSSKIPRIVIFVQRHSCGFITVCGDGALGLLHDPKTARLDSVIDPALGLPYQRYKIVSEPAPPRKKLPSPFDPRVSKIGLARILLKETLGYGLKLRKKEYRRVLVSRPCIYGTFSGPLGGFHPIKEKCTGCMRCVQEYPGVCSVDRNPEFYQFADSYWASEGAATTSGSPVATVLYEAETGKILIKGMGYKGPFAGPGWDSIWTDMSEIVRPTRDGVYGREFISTTVDVGRKTKSLQFDQECGQFSKTIEVSLPIIFDSLPANLNSHSILESVAGASLRTGTIFIATPTQAKQLRAVNHDQLVPLISTDKLSDTIGGIRDAPMIELASYDSSIVQEVQNVNPTAPISVRLLLTIDSAKTATDLVRKGIGVIHLVANYHGQSWDEGEPTHVKDLIRKVHTTLVTEALRDDVTLIASGGITRAEHVPKAIMCGADLVAIDTTVLVALQSRFLGECVSPESGHIAAENFSSNWGEQRLVNLLSSWHDQLIEILSAMGIRDVRRLRGDVGRAMFNEELEKEAFADIARRN